MPKLSKCSIILRILSFLGVLPLVLAGVGWYLVSQLNDSFDGDYLGARSDKWPYLAAAPHEKQQEFNEDFTALLKDYPELSPSWKDVPDDQNGFLQLLNLHDYVTGAGGAEASYRLSLPDDFRKRISEDSWNEEMELDEESLELFINELHRIGQISEQSCAGMDKGRFIWANPNFMRGMVNLLANEAKAAARLGDKEKSLDSIYAAAGLVRHLSQIETCSLIQATVGIVCELQVSSTIFEDLLPNLELSNEDLGKLRELTLSNRDAFSPVSLWRGEFNMGMPLLVMPFVDHAKLCQIIGRDRVYHAYVKGYAAFINSYQGMKDSILWDSDEFEALLQVQQEKSSFLERKIQGYLVFYLEPYMTNEIRIPVKRYHNAAALSFLIDGELPVELVTGKPYVFNEQTGEFSLPDDPRLEELDIKSISLPISAE